MEGLTINFGDSTILLKDKFFYALAQQQKTHPIPQSEVIAEFDFERFLQFFLYTGDQKDNADVFLSPYKSWGDWLDWNVVEISEVEMAEIIQLRVSANLVLSDGTHSDIVPLQLDPRRYTGLKKHFDLDVE